MPFVTVDGNVKLAVQDLNPQGKRTIVFVHGWPLSKEIFECQYDVLPEYGIRVVSFDLRGFGKSDKPWRGYSYDQLADDLHKVLQAMNLRDIVLCGFSMGGGIVTRYMARHKGARVKKLVLLSAASPSFVQRPGYPYGMTKEQVDTLITNLYNDRPKASSDFARQCFSMSPSEQYLNWIFNLSTSAAGWAIIKTAEALRDEDLREDLSQIKVPTVILHGTKDAICPFAFAQALNQGIANSVIIPFERSGHFAFYQERNKCNSALVDLIKTC